MTTENEMGFVEKLIIKLKQRLCSHKFATEDLEQTGSYDPAHRVVWPCSQCGKRFKAHCGLDISPEHGPMFRRERIRGIDISS